MKKLLLLFVAAFYNVRWLMWSAQRKHEVFCTQRTIVSTVLCRWLSWEFERQMMRCPDPNVLAAQVVNFLTGADPNKVSPETGAENVEQILAVQERVPELAYQVLAQDVGLREIVVNTAREYRLVCQLALTGFAGSATDARLADLERRYGHEFPRYISRSDYVFLISHFIEWSEGPAFPPTAEKLDHAWAPPEPGGSA